MHHHRLGGVNTAAVWVGIGAAFGNPHMEAILSCGVTRRFLKNWETMYDIKTGGATDSQELFLKDGKGGM